MQSKHQFVYIQSGSSTNVTTKAQHSLVLILKFEHYLYIVFVVGNPLIKDSSWKYLSRSLPKYTLVNSQTF